MRLNFHDAPEGEGKFKITNAAGETVLEGTGKIVHSAPVGCLVFNRLTALGFLPSKAGELAFAIRNGAMLIVRRHDVGLQWEIR
jgi:hypothetical protein